MTAPTTPAGSPHYRAAVENRYAGDARFTEATLAVAYEVRTANLIALRDGLLANLHPGESLSFTAAAEYGDLTAQIKSRL